MSFVIFDTEYTTWKGCIEHGWLGNQKKEIVQIAALKVSDNLDVIDTFNILCKPIVNPILSEYFENLTGITNEMVAKDGVSFLSAYERFVDFIDGNICFSHGWGGDYFSKSDGLIIDENLRINNIKPIKTNEYRNIAAIFMELYAKHNIDIKKQSSGQIVNLLNIKDKISSLGLDEHNAFFDVYSVLEGLKFFKTDAIMLLKNDI
ncbi:MAG: exonuclease domain-containing protein [Alphaproteobacteria bacterium]